MKLNAAQLRKIVQEAASAADDPGESAIAELAGKRLTVNWVRKTLQNAKRDLGEDGEGVEWDEMIEKLEEVEALMQSVYEALDKKPQRVPKGSVSRVDALMNNRLGINR
jgi:hypothetical protein